MSLPSLPAQRAAIGDAESTGVIPALPADGCGHNLVIVANRLPVDGVVEADGSTTWHTSPGGLVAAMQPGMQRNGGAWVGSVRLRR